MATLKHVPEPDRAATEEIHALIERLRALFREDPSDTVWNCWASESAHGYAVRLQQVRRVAPYGGRTYGPQTTYSGGGSAEFLVADVGSWLRAQLAPPPKPQLTGKRRRSDDGQRRGDPSKA